MQRYTSDDKPSMYKADDGEFYLVEDIDPIIADRDIKAANLQLLVEKVLDYNDACVRCEDGGNDGGDIYDAGQIWTGLLDLARGLEQ